MRQDFDICAAGHVHPQSGLLVGLQRAHKVEPFNRCADGIIRRGQAVFERIQRNKLEAVQLLAKISAGDADRSIAPAKRCQRLVDVLPARRNQSLILDLPQVMDECEVRLRNEIVAEVVQLPAIALREIPDDLLNKRPVACQQRLKAVFSLNHAVCLLSTAYGWASIRRAGRHRPDWSARKRAVPARWARRFACRETPHGWP